MNYFGKFADQNQFAMILDPRKRHVQFLVALAVCLGFMGLGRAGAADPPAQFAKRVQPPAPVAVFPTGIPSDIQLLNEDTAPTLRFPVGHSSLNWTLMKPRIKGSYGWLDISRGTVRYTLVQDSQLIKEPDEGFELTRADVNDIKFEYNTAEFRDQKRRHFCGYVPASYWQNEKAAADKSFVQANLPYTGLILQALQNFDGALSAVKLQRQSAAPPPVVVQPVATPPPAPKPPPSPPALVIVAPSGAGENQTVEVTESPLTIRGVTMDSAGLPTITINGTHAALRPKSAQAAEFWSEPIALKPGDNPFEIVATNAEQAKANVHFVAHFTPKAPPNPRALGKQQIISLLQGAVDSRRVTAIVRDRGINFSPTPGDLQDIRAEGGSDDLIQAIQQAAAK